MTLGENKNGTCCYRSTDYKWHYYFGIIDTLTDFGIKKKGEYLGKVVF